jgi:hypothetical protein
MTKQGVVRTHPVIEPHGYTNRCRNTTETRRSFTAVAVLVVQHRYVDCRNLKLDLKACERRGGGGSCHYRCIRAGGQASHEVKYSRGRVLTGNCEGRARRLACSSCSLLLPRSCPVLTRDEVLLVVRVGDSAPSLA